MGVIVEMATLFGWRHYHTWSSVHSPAGFPDLVLVRPPRLIFAELKSQVGRVTPAQKAWLDDLYATPSTEVYLWRPSDLDDIERVLRSSSAPNAPLGSKPPTSSSS